MASPWKRYPLLSSRQSYKVDLFLLENPWAKPAIAAVIAGILILAAYFFGKGLGGQPLEPFTFAEQKTIIQKETHTIVKTIEVPGPGQAGTVLAYRARQPYLIGGWGDNLRWDGLNVKPLDGSAILKVDPANNIGSLIVEIDKASINSEDRTYLDGSIRIEFTVFSGKESYQNGGLTQSVELFGNTGREAEYLPRVTASLAGWGTAEVLLDGESVYSKLPAFFMINDALRQQDNSIALPDGRVFSPRLVSTGGFADPARKELTLMLYSKDPDKKNKPPVAVFIHLVFKEVWEGDSLPRNTTPAPAINTAMNSTNATRP